MKIIEKKITDCFTAFLELRAGNGWHTLGYGVYADGKRFSRDQVYTGPDVFQYHLHGQQVFTACQKVSGTHEHISWVINVPCSMYSRRMLLWSRLGRLLRCIYGDGREQIILEEIFSSGGRIEGEAEV
jgi:hypothetical protein